MIYPLMQVKEVLLEFKLTIVTDTPLKCPLKWEKSSVSIRKNKRIVAAWTMLGWLLILAISALCSIKRHLRIQFLSGK
jgi:hypothetical protein